MIISRSTWRRVTCLVTSSACLALAGCAAAPSEPTVRTVTVKQPVYIRPRPPAWLTAPLAAADNPAPIFVAPTDPDVVLGVTREGLAAFWGVVDPMVTRIQAWQAWAGDEKAIRK